MKVIKLDHLVLSVTDLETTIQFYTDVLGMELETFGNNRLALAFGTQKINLHNANEKIRPHARNPMPGSADLCLVTEIPLDQVARHLDSCNVPIIEGPVKRSGATGPLLSIYILDPDGNLIELANPAEE